ncbi:MAG TPA: hypothetical protein VMJ75_31120 [Candidatus Acidoferrales bacterium]|nr:hypothetical protein [Candidatus Acidoferrales bacterium]
MKFCLCLLAFASTVAAADKIQSETLRGKLIIQTGQPAAVETPDHRRIVLDGDQPTRKVLQDERINGFEMEARGHFTAPDRFTIDPQHTRALLVRDHGHLKMVTYWCDVCGIRAYTPGPCVCCQKETTLDLRDPNDIQ